jgi:hypothetical protein
MGPFQVTCVLAAAVLAAGSSISTAFAQVQSPARGGGYLPLPDEPNLDGERINSNTIAVVSDNLSATYVSIACDPFAALDDGDNFRVVRQGGDHECSNPQ